MRSRSRLRVLAGATACLVAAACTGGTPGSDPDTDTGSNEGSASDSDDEEAATAEGVTLRWLIEAQEDAPALQALEDHIAEFEASSGITIEIDTLPWENMRTIIQTQLRSGEGPDVFNWGSGPSFGGALAEAGLLYDLTDAYDSYGWNVYDFAIERVTAQDGTIYGIPGEMETIGIFYNTEIFADLGLDEPQDLDGLREAAETIRDADIIPLAVSDKAGWEGGHLLSMSLGSVIRSDGMEELFAGE
jgi:raffinose/stachyose/melibiose transport system substrate-binding protein